MRLSTKSLYGTRLMFELAINYTKGVIRLSEIVQKQGLSEKYSEQIMSQLKAAGLVVSQRGAEGGYVLSRPAAAITMKEIVETLEGSLTLINQEETSGESESSRFISMRVWERVSKSIEDTLASITLDDLVTDFISRMNELNYEI